MMAKSIGISFESVLNYHVNGVYAYYLFLGFRVDACKHMWPGHLEELYAGMSLPDGSQPFIFNEVSFKYFG